MNENTPKRRLPLGIIAIVPLIVGFGAYAFVAPQPAPKPAAEPAATASAIGDAIADATAAVAPTFVSPPSAATPVSPPNVDGAPPTPYPGAPVYANTHGLFHDGAWVRVNAGAGDCLNARGAPTLAPELDLVNICLPDGAEGYLSGTATQRDGHWWWLLVGAGYVADDYLAYVREASLREAIAPQFAGLGSIAFVRDPGEVWLMQADGSGQRRLYAAGDTQPSTYITDLSWSPDATRLSFNVPRYGNVSSDGSDYGSIELVVIDTRGAVLADVPDVAGRGWSPDGTRVGIVKGAQPQQMGGGWNGVPGWLDVATGDLHLIGDAAYYQQDPPAFNFDGTLLLVTRTSVGIVIMDIAGNERARIEQPKNVYYASPLWAPNSNRIGFHISEQDTPHYAVYDLAAGAIVARAEVPRRNPNIGGKCGGSDMWRSAWSRDGRSLLYSYTDGLKGTNGVWTWDVATGQQHLVPAFGAGAPSDGPGGRVVFSTGFFIMAGDASGALPALITDGRSPVWSPR